VDEEVSCTLGFYSPELPRDVPWIIFHVVGTFGYVAESPGNVPETFHYVSDEAGDVKRRLGNISSCSGDMLIGYLNID